MANEIKSLTRDLFGKLGYAISRTPCVGPPATVPPEPLPPDIDPEDIAVFRSVEPFTMTSLERVPFAQASDMSWSTIFQDRSSSAAFGVAAV
jgi:hypothetical protein